MSIDSLLERAEVASPIGRIVIVVHDGRLCALNFADRWTRREAALARRFGRIDVRPGPAAAAVADRLVAYFDGRLDALDSIPVDTGGTPFQATVWAALRTIGPGRTMSYADLSRAIGAPAAVRAVGAANGANPVGIVVPCHRVIGADGRLVGYGGGLERKRWLLRHEGALLA
jgi:methylated-DNA-[protein]-cysteine S-methyltransferase